MNRNFRTPYVINWTLGVQHALSGKLGLDLAYVGNHGVKLPGVVDLNQPDPVTGATPFATQAPYVALVNYLSEFLWLDLPRLTNDVHRSQLSWPRFRGRLHLFSCLDDLSSNWVAFLPQDSTRPRLDHGSSDEDIRHRLTLSVTYSFLKRRPRVSSSKVGSSIPSLASRAASRGMSMIKRLISAQRAKPQTVGFLWQTSRLQLHRSQWDSVLWPGNSACTGAIPQACLAAAASVGPNATASLTGVGLPKGVAPTGYCYMVGNSVLIPNAFQAFGTMGRNIFRDTGFHNVDLSVSKSFKFGERLKAQFRVETFNIFNHPNFANPMVAPVPMAKGQPPIRHKRVPSVVAVPPRTTPPSIPFSARAAPRHPVGLKVHLLDFVQRLNQIGGRTFIRPFFIQNGLHRFREDGIQ